MLAASPRRVAIALAALVTLGFTPLLPAGHAGAAVADSGVSVTDPSGDVIRAGSPTTEPKADIVNSSLNWKFARIPAGGQQTITIRVKPLVAGELSCQTWSASSE